MIPANGTRATSTYNDAGWLATVQDAGVSLQYGFDRVGTRRTLQPIGGGTLTTWTYDAAYQLLRTQQQGAYDITYSYDPAGNRLTQVRTVGGSTTRTTYTYNAANQLTGQVDSSGALSTSTYDANGNLLTLLTGSGLTTYTWDGENRATLVELPAGGRNTMVYDGQGMRRRFAEAAGVHQFVWDEENILAEQDGSGIEQVLYTLAPHGGVYPERSEWGDFLSQRRGSASYFHHYTGLGSTLEVSDASGASVQTYAYDGGEFGGQVSPDPTADAIGNRLTWVGRQGYVLQAEQNTYWLGARIYDPETGRFLSPDPLEGAEGNRYVYASNRPTMLVDPSGMICTSRTGSGCAQAITSSTCAGTSGAPTRRTSPGHAASVTRTRTAPRRPGAVGTPSAQQQGGAGSSGHMASIAASTSGSVGRSSTLRMSAAAPQTTQRVAATSARVSTPRPPAPTQPVISTRRPAVVTSDRLQVASMSSTSTDTLSAASISMSDTISGGGGTLRMASGGLSGYTFNQPSLGGGKPAEAVSSPGNAWAPSGGLGNGMPWAPANPVPPPIPPGVPPKYRHAIRCKNLASGYYIPALLNRDCRQAYQHLSHMKAWCLGTLSDSDIWAYRQMYHERCPQGQFGPANPNWSPKPRYGPPGPGPSSGGQSGQMGIGTSPCVDPENPRDCLSCYPTTISFGATTFVGADPTTWDPSCRACCRMGEAFRGWGREWMRSCNAYCEMLAETNQADWNREEEEKRERDAEDAE